MTPPSGPVLEKLRSMVAVGECVGWDAAIEEIGKTIPDLIAIRMYQQKRDLQRRYRDVTEVRPDYFSTAAQIQSGKRTKVRETLHRQLISGGISCEVDESGNRVLRRLR